MSEYSAETIAKQADKTISDQKMHTQNISITSIIVLNEVPKKILFVKSKRVLSIVSKKIIFSIPFNIIISIVLVKLL